MHYKNGRAAHENDPVITKSYNGILAGKITRLNPAATTCNGLVTFPVMGGSENLSVNVGECFHAEDALACIEAEWAKTIAAQKPAETSAVSGSGVIAALLIAFFLLIGSNVTFAQTNITTVDKIINLIGSPTNYAAEIYGTYAPKAPTKIGGGALLAYNVNNYVGLGIGLDWLGSLSLVSANVQLQAPFHPLPNQLPNLILSPFIISGVATAYTGGSSFNGNAVIISDVGAYLKYGHLWGGQFNIGGCYGRWTGTGAYDVPRYHVFAGWQHGF